MNLGITKKVAPVIEAEWRAGAGMDALFESIESTYKNSRRPQ